MIFNGISKVFSTLNDEQYNTIGAFWDSMSKLYGRENLRGLGYNWTSNSIEYVIGLKIGSIPNSNIDVSLPDNGWITVEGRTDNLCQIYARIYEDGVLLYEIESFDDNGNCKIEYFR